MRFAKMGLGALALASLLSSCGGQSGEKLKTAKGITYYRVEHKDGARQVKVGDLLTMHATYRIKGPDSFFTLLKHGFERKDSVLGSSHMSGMPYTVQIDTSRARFGFQDPFQDLHMSLAEGDSSVFEMPADSLFKGPAAASRPPFLGPGSILLVGMKVLRVETQAEQQARVAKQITDIASKGGYQPLDKGVQLKITQKGPGALPSQGDTLWVDYTGTFVDTVTNGSKPFDSSVHPQQPGRTPEPYKIVLGQHGVIEGWEIALAAMPVGTEAIALIPYEAAYGPQGMQGGIPPYSNLKFELKLVKAAKGKPLANVAPPMMDSPRMAK